MRTSFGEETAKIEIGRQYIPLGFQNYIGELRARVVPTERGKPTGAVFGAEPRLDVARDPVRPVR